MMGLLKRTFLKFDVSEVRFRHEVRLYMFRFQRSIRELARPGKLKSTEDLCRNTQSYISQPTH